jgi:quercetin dioxygenase-like cupin family protein
MRFLASACLVVGLFATAPILSRAQKAGPSSRATLVSASELKWVDNPALKGAQQAVLWGDPATAGYGALKRIPAGTNLPMHWHTNATRVVALAGTIKFTLEGAPPKDLGPQSYASIPGGVKHAAICNPGPDCVYFETSSGAYDLKPR